MSTFSERLTEFFCDDEGMTKEQVRADLKEAGVDVDRFVDRIHTTIRKSLQASWREKAAEERSVITNSADTFAAKVLAFPVERLQQIAADAENGLFGPTGQELAIACRNKTDRVLPLDELRALVQDILTTTVKEDEIK